MNLSQRIEFTYPITEERLLRLNEFLSFTEHTANSQKFGIESYEGETVFLDYHGFLEELRTIGLTVELDARKSDGTFYFANVDIQDFMIEMVQALPEDFTDAQIFDYLTRRRARVT